ncbi:MAG: ribosome small subunit-dependent GTPase A, partial [Cyanothece sp. SIO1E1]|nr:ribosome small subunit-dependent GTPase A [Cyanothece sp. SIO1E1]
PNVTANLPSFDYFKGKAVDNSSAATYQLAAALTASVEATLINQLIPTAGLRVSEVSGKLGRGRHTTRHVELFELPNGGLVADTPGFNQPDIECTPAALADCFPEIKTKLAQNHCQFSNCLHRDEPNCAVQGNWERYEHYLEFLTQVITHQQILEKQRDAESTLKSKIHHSGKIQHEPKLEIKKYRRPSRRAQRQTLQDLCQDLEELDYNT